MRPPADLPRSLLLQGLGPTQGQLPRGEAAETQIVQAVRAGEVERLEPAPGESLDEALPWARRVR